MLLIRSSASERSSKLFKSIKMCFPKSKSFAFPKCLQRSFASWRKGKGGVEKSKTTHSWIVSPFLFCGWTFKCLSSCVFWIPARLTQLCITPRSKISVLCSLQCLVLSDKTLKARSPLLCVNSVLMAHIWYRAALASMAEVYLLLLLVQYSVTVPVNKGLVPLVNECL